MMKKGLRVLSAALAAVMLLSVCALALSEETSVYIPERIAKLGLPEMPEYITLKTRTESASVYSDSDSGSGKIRAVEEGDIALYFSQKPDWAGVIWMDGWETLEVDEDGYAVTNTENHTTQPGIWATSGPVDLVSGLPEWRWNDGGDYAFLAGVGAVVCQYGRSGSINYVEYTVEEDFFRTGMAGASTIIRWEPVKVTNYSARDEVQYETSTITWYVSCVTATYPAGNAITGVRADYRNDARNTLGRYTITYATSDTETYTITYAPAAQNRRADEPISGEYTVGGTTYVSGSGDNQNKWYTAGYGTQLRKSGLRAMTSFKSPRVK